MWRENCTVTDCNFNGNTAKNTGGAISCSGANSTMFNCNFTNNHALYGDNVYWYWTVEEFLNKYGQINDYDYVYIRNGAGTPSKTIVLNKKGITISSAGNVTFDAKGGNFHFEVTGDNVLIENLSFRNFNFTSNGGAIEWNGTNGILNNCNFINNTAKGYGGSIFWDGNYGSLTNSIFTGNNAIADGGAVYWRGIYSNLTSCTFNSNTANVGGAVYLRTSYCSLIDSTFINNTAINGGGLFWRGNDGILSNSIFTNNTSTGNGGGLYWSGASGTLKDSTFTGNSATTNGGAIRWDSTDGNVVKCNFIKNKAQWGGGLYFHVINCTLKGSTFIDNTAINNGGAVYWNDYGSMSNCSFINSRSIILNGIRATKNLNLNGGNGIVYVSCIGTISGISIIVLNNETYYYPPSTNINLIKYR